MNYFFIILVASCTMACASQQTIVSNDIMESNETHENEMVIEEVVYDNWNPVGTVLHNKFGCTSCVEIEIEPGVKNILYVVNLPEEFNVQGMRLSFDWNLSRAPLPEGCNADKTVSVSNVKRID